MGKASKATKKFQAKHLKQAIRHRKVSQKISRGKRQRQAGQAQPETHQPATDDKNTQPGKPLEAMSIDEFLNGGFLEAKPAENIHDGSPSGDSSYDLSSDEVSGDEDDSVPNGERSAGKRGHEHISQDHHKKKLSTKHNVDAGQLAGGASDSGSDSSGDEASGQQRRRKPGVSSLKADVAAHKAHLQALKEQDPDFYAYLQSTDNELLNFGKDSEDEMDSEEEEEGNDAALVGGQEEVETGSRQQRGVTVALVEEWCQAAQDKASLGAVRNLLKAYRVACHYGDDEEQAEDTMRMASSAVYNKLMLFVLRDIDGIFRRMLLDSESEAKRQQSLTAKSLVRLPRWRKVDPLVKSYLGNTLHLLGALTDGGMLAFILRRLRASTVFMAPYEKLQRRLLKAALGLFGSADNAPRVQAVLLVRQMALDLPQPALDNCLKGVYRAFSNNAKFVNAASMPQINFMTAAVVEMYGINAAASYQHAFSFIRQLAVLMRTALTSKSKDAYREVYCWQTMNCLELWAKLLAAKADEPELRPLVYPVTQLLLGAARLVPSPAYFPLRLRCARALTRLGEATDTYIPIGPILLEVLQWSDLHKAPKPGAGQQPDILLQLRAGKSTLRTAQFQEEVVSQVMELLAEHLAHWGCHIAFPELSFLTQNHLRKFIKHSPVERFRKMAKQLLDAVEKNVVFVGRARDKVDFSPKDLAQVATFLAKENEAKQAPIQQYARVLLDRARQRLQLRLADSLELGHGQLTVSHDSEEEAEEPTGSLLPRKQTPASGHQQPGTKRQKTAAQQQQQQQQQQQDSDSEPDVDGHQDEIMPYQLSDDDDIVRGSDDADGQPESDDEHVDVSAPEHAARRPAHKPLGAAGKKAQHGKRAHNSTPHRGKRNHHPKKGRK